MVGVFLLGNVSQLRQWWNAVESLAGHIIQLFTPVSQDPFGEVWARGLKAGKG